MRAPADAAEFGVGDVVLGDDVGDQRAHAHEPAADADQHQRQRRQDRVQQHAGDEARVEAARQVHLRAAADRQHRPEIAEHDQQHEGDDVVGDRMESHRHDAGERAAAGCRDSSRRGRPAGCRDTRPAGWRSTAAPRSMAARARSAPRPASGTPTATGRNRPVPCASRTPGTGAASPPCSPYSSRSDWRISAIASGLVLPNEVLAAMVCSTGSIGVAWVMKKVMLTPMNTTSTNWPSRRSE